MSTHVRSSMYFQAIDAKQNGTYRVRVVDVAIDVDSKKRSMKQITSISQLHNFGFESQGISVWKAYRIGKGEKFSLILH